MKMHTWRSWAMASALLLAGMSSAAAEVVYNRGNSADPESLDPHKTSTVYEANILRDLSEDAARGRLYLPRELLQQHRVAFADPAAALRDPGLAPVCDALALRAQARFADAERRFERGDRRQLRPALIMMHVYRRTLDRLIARGWRQLEQPVRLATPERLWLALRYWLP